MKWTSENIPALEGRIAVVTGANSGLGYHTTRALAMKGARVIMACRDLNRGEEARQRILAMDPVYKPELLPLDLSSLSSVRSFAEQFKINHQGPDLLINNAGLMAIPYRKTEDGFEMQFGVNHLGHFALSALLWPGIRERKGARIVSVSSLAHHFGKIRFGDIHWEKRYSKWGAYGMSKLSNLLFIKELARRLGEAGTGIIAAAAHPGYADTSLQSKGMLMAGSEWKAGAFNLANRVIAQSGEMGALPTLFAATAPVVEQGQFFGPSGYLKLVGYPTPENPNPGRVNEIVARELWNVSEKLTGHQFIIS